MKSRGLCADFEVLDTLRKAVIGGLACVFWALSTAEGGGKTMQVSGENYGRVFLGYPRICVRIVKVQAAVYVYDIFYYSDLSRQTDSSAKSAGVTPLMRVACPIVSG